MNNPVANLLKALVDSFRPRLFVLTLVAVSLAAIFWIGLIWWSIDPLYALAVDLLTRLGLDMTVYAGTEPTFMTWLKFILVPLLVFGLLWPLVATSAVLLAGFYVTPAVVRYLAERDFKHLQVKGNAGFVASLWVALKSVVVFVAGWLVTLPLWLIPGMALILPVLWTAYLLISVMRFDALAYHATTDEIARLKRQDSSSVWLIGAVCAFLSFVPPILLIMPVMSAVAFTRHYLTALSQMRTPVANASAGKVIDQPDFPDRMM